MTLFALSNVSGPLAHIIIVTMTIVESVGLKYFFLFELVFNSVNLNRLATHREFRENRELCLNFIRLEKTGKYAWILVFYREFSPKRE